MLFSTTLSISWPRVGYSCGEKKGECAVRKKRLITADQIKPIPAITAKCTMNLCEHTRTVDMEYSLLTSKWHCPSLGITMPAILLSIPKCESASLTNTSKRIESFLQPILSYWETNYVPSLSSADKTNDSNHKVASMFTSLRKLRDWPIPHKQLPAWWRRSHTPADQYWQTLVASRWSRWTCRCCSLVTSHVCIQKLADRLQIFHWNTAQVKNNDLIIRFSQTPDGCPGNSRLEHTCNMVLWIFNTVYLQGLASSSSVILMKGSVGFSTNDPKPIRNLLVRLAISLDKEEPRSLIFCRSSNMDADRSIR